MTPHAKLSFIKRFSTALLLVVLLATSARLANAQTVYLGSSQDERGYFITDSYLKNGVDIGSSTRLEGRIPLFLVHGINAEADPGSNLIFGIGASYSSLYYKWGNFLTFFNSRPELVAKYKIYGYGYRSNEKTVSKLAEDFGTLIRKLEIQNPELAGKRIAIIAHSMGGLITREFMLNPQNGVSGVKWGERVASLITLGTPHHGSPLNNNSNKIFGSLGGKLPLSVALVSWELNTTFQFIGGSDWNDPNRSDMLWDNYDNLFTYNFITTFEDNFSLKLLNIFSQYDSKVIAYAGTIRGYPATSSFARIVAYTPGDGILGELGFAHSDGVVPSVSALFDEHFLTKKPLVLGYDHSQLYLGKEEDPTTDPHFINIGQDLDTIAVALTPPSEFTVSARPESVGTASRVVLTRNESHGATGYQVFRNGQPLGIFNLGSREFRDNSVSAGTSYSYYVEASNSSGQKTPSNTVQITAPNSSAPDSAAPGLPVSLSAFPRPWARNNQFSVAWNNPTDPSGISKVWFKLGSAPTSGTDGAYLSLPQFNPFPIGMTRQEGIQTIYVWLEDGRGNKSHLSAASTTLQLDVTKPTVSITSHSTSTPVSTANNAITLSGAYADSLSGVASVTWQSTTSGSGAATLAGPPSSGTWTASSIALFSGANLIKVRAVDVAGNEAITTLTVNYLDTSNSGSLSVGIQPQGAVDAGAQWRLAGETTWRAPGAVGGIPVGSKTVEFKAVDGWITPLSATIAVLANSTVVLDSALGTYRSGTVSQAPDVPSNPYPLNGAVNVPRSGLTLTWSGGHPTGSPDFAVAFDTVNPPGFIAGFGTVPGRTYSLATREPLLPATTYYWRVRGKVGDLTTDSPVWRFTTDYSYADLIPYEIVVDGSIEPGATVTVRVKVKNQGTFTSAVGCRLTLYLSQTPQGRERRLDQFNTLSVPVLAPGEEVQLQQSVTLANLPAGQSFIDAWVDSALYGINEKDYENNVQSLAISYIDGKNPVVTEARLASALVKTGHSNSIVYFATDDVGIKTVDFYYSTNSGLDWTPIAEGYAPPTPPTYGAVYPWLVPANLPAGSNLLVRVVARDASGNSGETNAGPYLIRSGTAPMVTVLSPNGGELWNMGSQQQISWNLSAPNGVGNFRVYFYRNNTIDVLSVPLPSGNGTYTWTLPTPLSTTNGLIRISVTDLNGNEAEDYSDGFFSVRDTSAPPPAPWIDPINVTTSAANNPVTGARIATDAAGNVHLAYLSTVDVGFTPRLITQTVRYMKRTGSVWSVPQTVYSVVQQTDGNLTGYYSLRNLGIAASSSGIPHLVWATSYSAYSEQNKAELFYTDFNGSAWSQPQNLSMAILGGYQTAVLSWQSKANCPSVQAYEGAVSNNRFYVFANGGATYEYNPTGNQWTTKASAPGGISGFGAAEINGLIYGLNVNGTVVQIYNPSTDSWNTGAPIPTPRDGMSIVAANGKMHTFGGSNSRTVEAYDPQSNSWSAKADMPTARQYAATAVVNGKVYVIGGSGNGNQLSTVEVYDPANNTWAVIPKPIVASWPVRDLAVAVTLNNRIYLMGGRRSNEYQATVDEFDPATSSWQPMNPMSMARGMAVAGVIQSQIAIVGGYDGSVRTSSTEMATITGTLNGAISGSPTIAVDSSDKVHVVWQDGGYIRPDSNSFLGFSSAGQGDIYHANKLSGQSWSLPSRLTTSSANFPTISVGGANHLHLAYVTGNALGYRQWDGATWSSEGMAVTNANVNFSYPRLAANTNNQLHLVWKSYDQVLMREVIDYSYFDGTAWSTKESVAGPGSVNFPTVEVDSFNRPHVTWEDRTSLPKIYHSSRASGLWSPRTQLNRDAQVVSDGSSGTALFTSSNELHVVWNSSVNGNTEVIYNHANVGSTNDMFVPSVSVSAPASGQMLSIGSSFPIHWSAADNIGVAAIHLHYSTNSGSSWVLIATNQSYTGAFAWLVWQVPNLGTNVAQIRVTALDAAGNSGAGFSGNFTTVDATPPVISISAPIPPAILSGGITTNITWTATDNIGVVRIDLDYSLDNGATWLGMGTNLSNTGTYPWTVPPIPTSTLLLRATAQDAVGLSTSFTSQPLTIVRGNTPPLAPSSPFPLDGSTFVLTQLPNFRWNSSDPDGDALIYYVRFGPGVNPPQVLTTTTPSFNPPALRPQRTYYWQVLVSDGKATNTGPLWSFTTEAGTLPPTSLAGFKRQTDGHFEFRFNGLFGESQLVQASTNLVDWFTVATFANSNAATLFLDSAASNSQRRFYRVLSP